MRTRLAGKDLQEISGTATASLYLNDQLIIQRLISENRMYELLATTTGTVNAVTFQYSMDGERWVDIPTASGEPNPDPLSPFRISWRPTLAQLASDLWVDLNDDGIKDAGEPAYEPGDDLYVRAIAGKFGKLGKYEVTDGLTVDLQGFIPYEADI